MGDYGFTTSEEIYSVDNKVRNAIIVFRAFYSETYKIVFLPVDNIPKIRYTIERKEVRSLCILR